jgi:hypothetical protein
MKMRRTTIKKMKKISIPFTKASQKDVVKVTVRLAELEPVFQTGTDQKLVDLVQGTLIIVTIFGNREVAFRVNRSGSTAATNAWPLFQPKVGNPISYDVTRVTVANEE